MLQELFNLCRTVVENPALNDFIQAHADKVRATYTCWYWWGFVGGVAVLTTVGVAGYYVLCDIRKERKNV